MNTILVADDESEIRSYLGSALSSQGYQVEFLKSSLPEDQLIEKIKCVRAHSSLSTRLLPKMHV